MRLVDNMQVRSKFSTNLILSLSLCLHAPHRLRVKSNRSATTWPPMFLHLGCDWVALVMMRYRLSTQGEAPRFNTSAMSKYRLTQAGKSQFPQTAFSISHPC